MRYRIAAVVAHIGIVVAFRVGVMKNTEKHSPMINREQRMILVTGATGNIGAVVVARLLEQDKSAHLILLVRGESVELARQRVENTIRFLSPEFDLAGAVDRITVLTGDITQLAPLDLNGDIDYYLSKGELWIE